MPIITWYKENPEITKRGASEFLETQAGLKKIRSWAFARGEWNLTRLGQRYFRDRPSDYIRSLPVRSASYEDVVTPRFNAGAICLSLN